MFCSHAPLRKALSNLTLFFFTPINRLIYSAISNLNFKNSYLDHSGLFESQDSTFFFSGGTTQCTSGAPEGRFGDCTKVDDCWSCVIDVSEDCPPGTYASSAGTTTASECVPSPRGFWSPGGSAEYFQCKVRKYFQINLLLRRLSYFCHLISYTSFQFGQAGYYATDSATDEDGYGVPSGASSEVACPAGMISTSPEAIECEPCNPPTSSSQGSMTCDECM